MQYIFLLLLLSQFSQFLHAEEPTNCEAVLERLQEEPSVLSELRIFKLNILNSKNRTSRLLLEKNFQKKLSEVALLLKISEQDVLNRLGSSSITQILIKETTPIKSIETKNEILVHKQIKESFLKSYFNYEQIKTEAKNIFKEIFIDNKKTPFLYDGKIKLHLKTIKTHVLLVALQEEFSKEFNIVLNSPLKMDFKKIITAEHQVSPIVSAVLNEDETFIRAMLALGAEIPSSFSLEHQYNLMTAYFTFTEKPKVEFIEFLRNELDQSLTNGKSLLTILTWDYKHITPSSVASYLNIDEYRRGKFDVNLFKYLYTEEPSLFDDQRISSVFLRLLWNSLEEDHEAFKWFVHIPEATPYLDRVTNGDTPLHDAVYTANRDHRIGRYKDAAFNTIKILLDAGADKTIKNQDNLTPHERAVDFGCEERIIRLLE